MHKLLTQASGSYLDKPSCLDSMDVMTLQDGRKKLCSDIGDTVDIGKCDEWEDVQRHCPRTCNMCEAAEDSEGLFLLPNLEATTTCEALDVSLWCVNFDKIRTFCPQACLANPSAMPSQSPSVCSDVFNEKFFAGISDSGKKKETELLVVTKQSN